MHSRKLVAPIVSATIATMAVTTFATVRLVQIEIGLASKLLKVAGMLACSAVAVVLVMSLLYKTLVTVLADLQASEAAAHHQALHDQLTGLPNRALLQDRIGQGLSRCRRDGGRIALLVLDLDRFKQVNDTFGHCAGDLLVQQVGARLSSLARETDTVARVGGDEFAIIMQSPKNTRDVTAFCDRIVKSLREPFYLSGKEARIGVSVGAIITSDATATPTDLLRKADITMYQAKACGRDCYKLFSDEMDAQVQRRGETELWLRKALASGEGLDLHYQPLVSNKGIITGFECLLRCHDAHLGALPPAEVIPIAEATGLIDGLGEFVFRRACETSRVWPHLSFAVNLSPIQFRKPGLPKRLQKISSELGANPSALELEITESLLIDHGDECAEAIQDLRQSGFRVALDDFGTGYSSLSYLRRFEVDKIKLDRSFMHAVDTDETVAIIRAAVLLGQAMNLEVVAEGIADKRQEQVALEAGCTGLQGFLYAPAIPIDQIRGFLGRWRSETLAA